MPFAVFLAIAALFAALGIMFASGKGAGLIAGYNTASPEKKACIDEKKLLKAMSVLMFVLAGCFIVSASGGILRMRIMIFAGQGLFAAALIAGLVYLNTGDRFRKQ